MEYVLLHLLLTQIQFVSYSFRNCNAEADCLSIEILAKLGSHSRQPFHMYFEWIYFLLELDMICPEMCSQKSTGTSSKISYWERTINSLAHVIPFPLQARFFQVELCVKLFRINIILVIGFVNEASASFQPYQGCSIFSWNTKMLSSVKTIDLNRKISDDDHVRDHLDYKLSTLFFANQFNKVCFCTRTVYRPDAPDRRYDSAL